MNDMLDPNTMAEATRLTRAGRLTEATALLQRMLRGEPAPNTASGTAGVALPDASRRSSTRRSETIEETDRPPL